ncbi:SDR family oxidoreductase [Lacticaseibacillus mingshuiensis]|uniref:SDR family oxidoreductase n=1 Tax=Lacticaseibacillus mingshuiensis TaxID=2799574 RepID=UPI0019518775|nr:NAD(P)H-binding protein [Lacticaseibacillus mingshuiensis]
MKLTLVGSLGHINSFTIPALVAQGHDVTVITSSEARVPEIEQLGVHAQVGSIEDTAFLTDAFTGADAVYIMLTGRPAMGQDIVEAGRALAERYRIAIVAADVHRVVDLSSVGADQGPEVGSLYTYHIMENILRAAPDVTYTFVRPVGFFANLAGDMATIKHDHKLYRNFPATICTGWVAPQDIAKVVVEALNTTPTQNDVRYAISQWLTGYDLVAELAAGLGIPDLTWQTVTDDERLAQLKKVLPPAFALSMMKSAQGQRKPDFYADLQAHRPQLGMQRLKDVMPQLKAAFDQVQ